MIGLRVKVRGAQGIERRIARWQAALPVAVRKGLHLQAQRLRTIIVQGVRNQAPGGQAFRPLADTTKAMKRSSKALINRGDLVRSVGVDAVRGGSAYFVGVSRTARGSDGKPLANIAAIMEEGTGPYLIPVTDKLRRFWYAMFIQGVFQAPLKPSTTMIRHPGVPARPYLQPAFAEWERDVNDQFARYLARAIRLTPGGGR